jgi:hypothetical protein
VDTGRRLVKQVEVYWSKMLFVFALFRSYTQRHSSQQEASFLPRIKYGAGSVKPPMTNPVRLNTILKGEHTDDYLA